MSHEIKMYGNWRRAAGSATYAEFYRAHAESRICGRLHRQRGSSADIKTDSISAAFEDHHGIKWDKEGNMIATFTIDDAGDIVSIESVSDEN